MTGAKNGVGKNSAGGTNSAGGLKRRQFMALGGAFAGVTALAGVTGLRAPVFAPPVFAQGRKASLSVGDMTIKVLSDGHMMLPASMIVPVAPKDAGAAARKYPGYSGETIKRPVNVTFIKTPKDLIMIDVGSGPAFMASTGKLGEALDEAGIDAEAITKVVYTHAHPDHLWGTVNDFDELSFPNAEYFISGTEFDWWMADDVLKKLSADRQSFGLGAQSRLKAIKDRVKFLKPGDDVVTGIRAVDTSGHTTGHLSFEVGNSQTSVLITGDALTDAVLSFRHPEWQSGSDYLKDKAVATRKRLLDRLAADQTRIVGYHLPYPGIGIAKRKNGAYAFEAAA